MLTPREHCETKTPAAAVIFDFLERHWPYLVSGIESRIVPPTNNAIEQVNRIFTQHYQRMPFIRTFCGFENIESARLYLGVFEKRCPEPVEGVYRFTPFSNDAQERIRGKCPLELTGYEIQKLPNDGRKSHALLFRGLALQWPASAFQELVPNV